MVDVALFNYIKTQLAKGHSITEVKQFLLSQGHQAAAIDACMTQIYKKQPEQSNGTTHNPHKVLTIIVILMLLISLILIALFYVTAPKTKTDDFNLTFEATIDKISFSTSEDILFHAAVKGNNPDKAFPITMDYSVRSDSGNLIYSNTDEYDVQDSDVRDIIFQLPRYIEGRYYLEIAVKSGRITQKQTLSFLIQDRVISTTPTCYDGILNQGETKVDCGGPCRSCIRQCPIFIDDKDSCTRDICSPETNYDPVHEPIVPCCGNSFCENDEDATCPSDCEENPDNIDYSTDSINATITYLDDSLSMEENIQKIRILSRSDFESAMRSCKAIRIVLLMDQCVGGLAEESGNPNVCKSILDTKTGDRCFAKLASKNSNPDLCQNLVSDLRRDSCYMGFALKGNYLVCDLISDQFYKDTCMELKDLASKNPEAVSQYAKNYEVPGE